MGQLVLVYAPHESVVYYQIGILVQGARDVEVARISLQVAFHPYCFHHHPKGNWQVSQQVGEENG